MTTTTFGSAIKARRPQRVGYQDFTVFLMDNLKSDLPKKCQ